MFHVIAVPIMLSFNGCSSLSNINSPRNSLDLLFREPFNRGFHYLIKNRVNVRIGPARAHYGYELPQFVPFRLVGRDGFPATCIRFMNTNSKRTGSTNERTDAIRYF